MKKLVKRLLPVLLAIVLVCLPALPVRAATLFECYNTGDDNHLSFYDELWEAQTFTPSTAHKITSVKLLLCRGGEPGEITVSIRATDAETGHPTDGDLCSGTTDGNTLPTNSPYEWREITLGDGYDLVADTKYAIVIRALAGNGLNLVRWRFDSTEATYTEGNLEHSDDSGVGWASYTEWDFLFEEYGEVEAAPPTVTTQAATDIEATTATGNGNITAVNNGTCDLRGFVWDLDTHGDPGNVAPGASGYANDVPESNSFGTGAFTGSLTGLPTGDTIYCRAYAHNENGYGYGDEVNFLTKPAAPTNVSATDGVHTDKVVITWTKSTGATDYHVWRGAVDLGAAGDVATFDDAGADAPTVTAGTASASDGTAVPHVVLSLAGKSANNGATHTYKVVASNATGDSADSTTDTGYRGVGALTYQWQRSAGDSDDTFGAIGGGTTDPYNDVGAPANGDGRWYYCEVSATGATTQDSTHDRGYRGVLPTVTVQAVTDISYYTATGNGNITSIGTDNCDKRGFVWDLGTHGDPGDVAPGASGYANNGADTGDFGTGVYTYGLTGLLDDTTYYVRAYVHSPAGYDYSDTEVNFKTLESVAPTVVTYNADVSGIDTTLNGEVTDLSGAPFADYRGFVWDMATHTAPGDVAPATSGYANNWTEAGSFNIGAFDYEATGLTELTTYYYRACGHTADGWGYGDEVTFFTVVDDKVYLEFRPDLDETTIAKHTDVPTSVRIGEAIGDGSEGIFVGYSLPLWSDDYEELYFTMCVPDRWDGESDVVIHIYTALANANENTKAYRLELAWERATPNEEVIPLTENLIYIERQIYSNNQYEFYRDGENLDYDIDDDDLLEVDDLIAFRIRRVNVTTQNEIVGELIITHVAFLFARGDLLGDPAGGVADIIDDLIADETLIGGADLIYLFLGLMALGLTMAMFHTRNMMLGFPCVIFWAILGGYAYTESTTAWGDWQYYLFFACTFGMTIFCALAMFVLRTKKEEVAEGDELIDEGKDDLRYTDEGKSEEGNLEGSGMSKRTKGIRGRAKQRRTGDTRSRRL